MLNILLLDKNSKRADQPPGAGIELKAHQLSLLQKCMDLEQTEIQMSPSNGLVSSIGILGDKVGSGKSYVAIALVMNKASFAPIHKTYKSFADNHIFVVTKTIKTYVNTNVFVIPHSLCKQWEAYFREFAPRLRVLVVNRNSKICATDWSAVDVVLVTCTMYNNFATLHSEMIFARLFYDEADSINLPLCRKLQARFFWFITASYSNLLNPFGSYSRLIFNNGVQRMVQNCRGVRNNGFIKELFYTLFSNTTVTPYIICRNDDAFVDESLLMPAIEHEIVECKTPITINVLTDIVESEVIRCLNANNVKRAIQCLHPSQRSNEDNIIELCIEGLKKNLKNNALQIEFTQVMEFDQESQRIAELEKLDKIHQDLENKMQAIKKRIREADECPICQEPFVQRTVGNCCNNSYCFKCISTWLMTKPQCPLCKEQVSIKDMYVIEGSSTCSSDDECGARAPSPSLAQICKQNVKLTNLINILRLPTSKKCLVFSMYDETFEPIVVALKEEGISFSFLKGACATITHAIERFESGDTRVLLINPQYYGSGLNLQCTTDVVMFHKLDTEMEKQVIGRANRFGRVESLKVWYLLHANEIPA